LLSHTETPGCTARPGVLFGKSSYKPDSVFVWPSLWDAGCPAPLAAHRGALPSRRSRRGRKSSGRALRPCSRWGLPGVGVSADPVRSYFKPRRAAPFRPYPPRPHYWGRGGRYVSVALSGGSPRPAVSRHRCPAESGLSSDTRPAARAAATRMTSGVIIAHDAPVPGGEEGKKRERVGASPTPTGRCVGAGLALFIFLLYLSPVPPPICRQ